MKWSAFRTFWEGLSFILWMLFTIGAIALAGLGIEGILLATFLLLVSGTQPDNLPLATTCLGILGIGLSMRWRRYGVKHLHYVSYDSPRFDEGKESPSSVLHQLIEEVATAHGFARTDVRTRAKAWLIDHASSLDEEDVDLARTHFGYLLPAGWGSSRR